MGRRLRIMSGRGRCERQWPIGPTGFARLWSNLPPASHVSTEVDGDPGPIRTGDLPLRRGTLYPAELRGQVRSGKYPPDRWLHAPVRRAAMKDTHIQRRDQGRRRQMPAGRLSAYPVPGSP